MKKIIVIFCLFVVSVSSYAMTKDTEQGQAVWRELVKGCVDTLTDSYPDATVEQATVYCPCRSNYVLSHIKKEELQNNKKLIKLLEEGHNYCKSALSAKL